MDRRARGAATLSLPAALPISAVVGDRREVARERRETVHLAERLLAAGGGPARHYRAPAAGCEHQQVRSRALDGVMDAEDRKSTRLNSSHSSISYAVFCSKQTT